MNKTSQKVLVIGLDGGTFDLLLPLTERGHMPHLAALLRDGCWGRLNSTTPPFTAVAWSSYATGQNPGGHGILSFRTKDRYHYNQTVEGFVDARQLHNTLWDILSADGKKVGVVNVPITYPPRSVNGFMITGMMTPPNAETFTYPPELADELDDYMIDVAFIRDGENFRRYGLPPKPEMLNEIRRMTELRTQTCTRLLREREWDFFMMVYTSTDRISHFFWDDLSAMFLEVGTAEPPMEKELLAYFSELDTGIGELIATAGDDTQILFMSDHGFGSSPSRRFHINIWLEELGLLQRRRNKGLFDMEYWRVKIGRNVGLKRILRRFIPQSTQDNLSKTIQSSGKSIIDWSKTRSYFVTIYFHVCGIELNVIGEKAQGIMERGAEYEVLREHIIKEILLVVDDVTGERVVETAVKREDIYSGPYVEVFPDIILTLNPKYVGAQSLAGSHLFENQVPFRPGEHRQDGIFIAHGSATRKGADLPNLDLPDVAATILYLLDTPIPTSFDGRVLTEIITPAYHKAHPQFTQELETPIAGLSNADTYSQRDEADLEQRLRGLGYLD